MPRRARLEITYCTQCRWLLRAAWTAQELLTTFEQELGEAALVPGSGGVFKVRLSGRVIFDRARSGRFPEMKELKQLVRDAVAPGRGLGHSDRPRAARPRAGGGSRTRDGSRASRRSRSARRASGRRSGR